MKAQIAGVIGLGAMRSTIAETLNALFVTVLIPISCERIIYLLRRKYVSKGC